MQPIYIGLGTNLGNRQKNLDSALELLSNSIQIVKKSSVYETDPWGYQDQPKFLNMVIEVFTTMSPIDLLSYLKEIENKIGREETFRYGPRVIDLDILFYGDVIINTTDLQIPHPKIQERGFVLVPLCEIGQDYIHPVLNQTIRDLLAQIDHGGIIRLETKDNFINRD